MSLGLDIRIGIATQKSSDLVAPLLGLIDGVTGASFHDFTKATDGGTFAAPDSSSNGLDFTASANKPGISGTLGATFDGTQLCTRDVPANQDYTIIMALRIATTFAVLIQDTAGTIYTQYANGDSAALLGTANFVDGVAVTTRAELYTALSDGEEHIFEGQGLSFGSTEDIQFGRSSLGHNGSIRRAALLPETAIGGNLAAARAAALVAVAA